MTEFISYIDTVLSRFEAGDYHASLSLDAPRGLDPALTQQVEHSLRRILTRQLELTNELQFYRRTAGQESTSPADAAGCIMPSDLLTPCESNSTPSAELVPARHTDAGAPTALRDSLRPLSVETPAWPGCKPVPTNAAATSLSDRPATVAFCASCLHQASDLVHAAAKGDFSRQIVCPEGHHNPLVAGFLTSLLTMTQRTDRVLQSATRTARLITMDEFAPVAIPASSETKPDRFQELSHSLGQAVNSHDAHVQEVTRICSAVSDGDLTPRFALRAGGSVAAMGGALNHMVDRLQEFSAQLTKVTLDVGIEGELGIQAVLPDTKGVWRDLTDDVNTMVENLT
ncbi:histidine kinase osmosensor, partial [Tieghemiomyces parasiticus]